MGLSSTWAPGCHLPGEGSCPVLALLWAEAPQESCGDVASGPVVPAAGLLCFSGFAVLAWLRSCWEEALLDRAVLARSGSQPLLFPLSLFSALAVPLDIST